MNYFDLDQYDYALPPELIRKQGAEPRDSARLFVYDTQTDTVTLDIFRNIVDYLPKQSFLVLNDTRVLPVRLWLSKATGGKIEVFVLMNQWDGGRDIPVLVDRKVHIGQQLLLPNGDYFEIVSQQEAIFFVHLESATDLSLRDLLDRFGETPVPHYLEGDQVIPEKILRERYQTIFAQSGASVAAPTAGLHFTDEVFADFTKKEISLGRVTLDVGRGTFASLTEQNFLSKTLHAERITVSDTVANRLNTAKLEQHPIIAVGTTALRTLESVCHDGKFSAYSGLTHLFVFPPHHFGGAEILITNFHLPKTSLMLLVDAFLRDKGAKRNIVDLYHVAIQNQLAFYSFGDSMLIL